MGLLVISSLTGKIVQYISPGFLPIPTITFAIIIIASIIDFYIGWKLLHCDYEYYEKNYLMLSIIVEFTYRPEISISFVAREFLSFIRSGSKN